MKNTLFIKLILFILLCQVALQAIYADAAIGATGKGLSIENGWFVHSGRIVWGYGQHNGWWRSGQRPNITRNAPGKVGPNRTEDLDKLTDAMLRFAYPGFEHNYGLWYDRRRDAHDTIRRNDAMVKPPFLEQPWARSDTGQAFDGLPRYDLTHFNDWYFNRLIAFSRLCDQKGTILFHNHYMQHVLLERQSHYVDFPWRPGNCIQKTDMPVQIPAANIFYEINDPVRRKLHSLYIRKSLDVLGRNTNVVFLCSQEYTGPLSFMQFWLDTVFNWEDESGYDVYVCLGGTKDVVDAILADSKRSRRIDVIDMRYWWYKSNGSLFAPQGGKQIPGRFSGAFAAKEGGSKLESVRRQVQPYLNHGMGEPGPSSARQIYRQVLEYRKRFPDKAILHQIPDGIRESWAFLMAGGSLLIGQIPYPGLRDPSEYVSPEKCLAIQPTYDFIRKNLATILPRMKPASHVDANLKNTWCLEDKNSAYLVYAIGGDSFQLDLSAAIGHRFHAKWFDPTNGELMDLNNDVVKGGNIVAFTPPDHQDWVLWLYRCL